MSRREFTPLSEIENVETQYVNWGVELPEYVPVDQIGVDVSRLDRMAKIGGFRILNIVGYVGDTTEFVPDVNGTSKSGESTAVMRGTMRKADLFKTDIGLDIGKRDTDFDHTVASVSLNVGEITDTLTKSGVAGALRSPSAWSDIMNDATVQGVRGATRENLFSNTDTYDKVMPIWCTGLAGSLEAMSTHPSLGSAMGTVVIFNATARLIKSQYDRYNGIDRSDKRFSMMHGIHADRILAVEALSRMGPLVKSLKPEN